MNEFIELKPVNEVPIIPLSELADGNIFGYTNDGDLKRTPTSELLSFVKSGVTGTATEANAPTTWTSGDPDLYESYLVVEPITTGSAWGIEVTQTNLDENFVYFNVKNGVISVFMTDKINGKSAYQSYLDTTTDSPPKTEAEWASLDISDGSITPEKTNFANTAFIFSNAQRFNKATIAQNFYVNAGTGALDANATYVASDFIYIGDCASITMTNLIHIAFYAENNGGSYISGREFGGDTIDVPNNAVFCRVSIYNDGSKDTFQLEKGKTKTAYSDYVTPTNGIIIPDLVIKEKVDNSTFVNLTNPATMYWLENEQLNVYFDNIVFGKLFQKRSDFYCSAFSYRGRFLEDKFRAIPYDEFQIKIKAENQNGFSEKYTTVKTAPLTNGNGVTRKILAIGDSTIANGYMLYKIKEKFATDVMNVDFVGTELDNTVLHEGHSGWAYSNFNTNFAGNPFWNSGISAFDLSYYLTQTSQTLGANDWVFIQLGINDLFPTSYLEPSLDVDARILSMQNDLTAMITSVHSHNADIRIAIAITIPPAISQDATGNYDTATYPFNSAKYSLEYYVKKGLVRWWNYLLETYDNTTMATNKIYLVPTNICIDRENNFPTTTMQIDAVNTTMETVQNNDVHPATTGYEQMSLPYIGIIKYFA